MSETFDSRSELCFFRFVEFEYQVQHAVVAAADNAWQHRPKTIQMQFAVRALGQLRSTTDAGTAF